MRPLACLTVALLSACMGESYEPESALSATTCNGAPLGAPLASAALARPDGTRIGRLQAYLDADGKTSLVLTLIGQLPTWYELHRLPSCRAHQAGVRACGAADPGYVGALRVGDAPASRTCFASGLPPRDALDAAFAVFDQLPLGAELTESGCAQVACVMLGPSHASGNRSPPHRP